MKSLKRRPFTLLELLIVLFILSLGIAVTGVKLKEAYDEQRFASEVQQVLGRLRLAQDLMLIMDADVTVYLAHEGSSKQVVCWLDVEKPLSDAWAKLAEKKLFLSAIHSFQFEGGLSHPVVLAFTLGKLCKGQLVLSDNHQKQQTIDLPGYPCLLKVADKLKQEADFVEQSQLLYPAEIYEELYAEKDPKK